MLNFSVICFDAAADQPHIFQPWEIVLPTTLSKPPPVNSLRTY